MRKYLLLSGLLFLFFCPPANADYYTWKDERGITFIADHPPQQGKSVKDLQLYKYDEDSNSKQKDKEKNSQAKKPEVVLYTKNDCKDCDRARDFLKSKGLSFTEYNMDTDKKAAEKRKEVDDGDEVPFAIINKSHVFGFSESVYNKILKTKPDSQSQK
jgi:glutaredoxin